MVVLGSDAHRRSKDYHTMYARWHAPSASATPWDGHDESSLGPAQRLVMVEHREAYERLHRPGPHDADFFNGYEREECPRCQSGDIVSRGSDARGVRRWSCSSCGRTFTPVTGTIFEGHRLSVEGWVEFLLELVSYESIAGMTRQNRRSPTTLPYHVAKVFAVLDGIQDGVVLSGRVQADETYYPLPASEEEPGSRGRKPGLSRNRICIAVACEEGRGGSSVFRLCGLGKPSGKRALAAYGPHLAKGCTLVHDRESAHNMLVRERGLDSESYNSREICGLPDRDNPLGRVNRLCFLVKEFLGRHSGFDRADIDGWLDLFSVIMNPPESKMEKVAMMLDRAMTNPKTLRYRDYYRQKPRPET